MQFATQTRESSAYKNYRIQINFAANFRTVQPARFFAGRTCSSFFLDGYATYTARVVSPCHTYGCSSSPNQHSGSRHNTTPEPGMNYFLKTPTPVRSTSYIRSLQQAAGRYSVCACMDRFHVARYSRSLAVEAGGTFHDVIYCSGVLHPNAGDQ